MKRYIVIMLLLLVFCGVLFAEGAEDGTGELLQEYDRRIDLISTNLDYVWVILSAMLVFFMQAGFMALESGMARSKNSINVAIKNLADFVLGVLGFWFIGFGLMFGKSWHGLIGTTDFLISIENPWTAAFFIFQAVFVGTAATIDSGAVCERAKLKQYILLSFLVSVVIYPIFGHWAWGSFLHGTDPAAGGAGWLELRGFKDFAGSSVVHSVGGWLALAGVIVVGPRIGKYRTDPVTGKRGKANKIAPGDMRFVFLGTFILFFAWFGFNCGSTLAATPDIAIIALNTTLAACFGCISASVLSWIFHPEKKIEGEMIANGVLAGLVGITAGCAFVSAESAAIIGFIAGIIVFAGSYLLEHVLKLDDVVGAIPVHAFCGVWGTLAVGFFIRPELLGDLTRWDQISIQFIGVAVCFLWAFGLGLLFYFLIDRLLGGTRVSEEEEILGLNIAEHGATSSIIELANTMNDLTMSGDFSNENKVSIEEGTEIGDLARLFNDMIERVKAALRESQSQKERAERMLAEAGKKADEARNAREELEEARREAGKRRTEYLGTVQDKVSAVTGGIEGVRESMSQASDVTLGMAESFNSMSGFLEEMLSSLSDVYSRMDRLGDINRTTTETLNDSKLSIENLKKVTEEIESMVGYINHIADESHILAINSGIEAARAGDKGAGFSVIAKEFGKLSTETTDVASRISLRLKDAEQRVSSATRSMAKILGIMDEVRTLNGDILGIVGDSRELSASVSEKTFETKKMVGMVSADIHNVVNEAESLAGIGKTVREELTALEDE